MADKRRSYTDAEIESMSAEEFEHIQDEATKPERKVVATKQPGGIRGYFAKRKKILSELDK